MSFPSNFGDHASAFRSRLAPSADRTEGRLPTCQWIVGKVNRYQTPPTHLGVGGRAQGAKVALTSLPCYSLRVTSSFEIARSSRITEPHTLTQSSAAGNCEPANRIEWPTREADPVLVPNLL